jgi:hypothetical protein
VLAVSGACHPSRRSPRSGVRSRGGCTAQTAVHPVSEPRDSEDTESRIVGLRGMYTRRINRMISERCAGVLGSAVITGGASTSDEDAYRCFHARVSEEGGGLFRDSDVDVMRCLWHFKLWDTISPFYPPALSKLVSWFLASRMHALSLGIPYFFTGTSVLFYIRCFEA